MRFLHTSDWHVGKRLRGRSRQDEHRLVLGEIVRHAAELEPDVVLVAGDLYESAAPAPEATALVWATLLALRATGAEVVVISGNHDHAPSFDALRPLAAAAGVTVRARVVPPDEGGVVDVTSRDGTTTARLALMPFVSQRRVVRALDLLAPGSEARHHARDYAERVGEVLGALCATFTPDTVNVVVAHGFVRGGLLGGGERDAQTVHDYGIDPSAFPASASYVALGHLHRTQQVPAPGPLWYSGAPIQVDFGEAGDDKHVLVVDAEPGLPARVEALRLDTPVRLLTVTGTLVELSERAASGELDGALLRVRVEEARRAGLAEEVRAVLPGAVDVTVTGPGPERGAPERTARAGRSPEELFAAFCAERGVEDPGVAALFAELHEELVSDT